jgi:hypothetical protein
VGTTSVITGAKADIRGANANNLSDLDAQVLTVFDTSSYAQTVGGGIAFGYKFNSSNSYIQRAAIIKAVKENSTDGNYASAMVFATTANGASTTEKMRLDASGNLGLGVTPSTGGYGVAFQFAHAGNGGAITAQSISANNYPVNITANAISSGSSTWKYFNTDASSATRYQQVGGVHSWHTAASGTAGNAISFTQAMTLDASGNLVVGGTSANVYGVNKAITLNASSGQSCVYEYTINGTSTGYFGGSSTATWVGSKANIPVVLYTNDAERARITSGGDLLVGTTSGAERLVVSGTINNYVIKSIAPSTSGTYYHILFDDAGTSHGSITSNGTNTAYNTTSDYRLKDNPQPLANSGAFIDALKPKTWSWKADGSKGVGFIAHEAQEVSPSSVVGAKDAVDKDGKPVMQAMEYGSAEFIANIVAELQSLRARVAKLEAK